MAEISNQLTVYAWCFFGDMVARNITGYLPTHEGYSGAVWVGIIPVNCIRMMLVWRQCCLDI